MQAVFTFPPSGSGRLGRRPGMDYGHSCGICEACAAQYYCVYVWSMLTRFLLNSRTRRYSHHHYLQPKSRDEISQYMRCKNSSYFLQVNLACLVIRIEVWVVFFKYRKLTMEKMSLNLSIWGERKEGEIGTEQQIFPIKNPSVRWEKNRLVMSFSFWLQVVEPFVVKSYTRWKSRSDSILRLFSLNLWYGS